MVYERESAQCARIFSWKKLTSTINNKYNKYKNYFVLIVLVVFIVLVV